MAAAEIFVPSFTLDIMNSSIGKYKIEPYTYKQLIILDSSGYSQTDLVTIAKTYSHQIIILKIPGVY